MLRITLGNHPVLQCAALGRARVPSTIQACRPEEQKPTANPKVPALAGPTDRCNFLLPISLGIAWDTWENWKMDYKNRVCSTRVKVWKGLRRFWKDLSFVYGQRSREQAILGFYLDHFVERLACHVLDANVLLSPIWIFLYCTQQLALLSKFC